jgi:hypothetical protein
MQALLSILPRTTTDLAILSSYALMVQDHGQAGLYGTLQ